LSTADIALSVPAIPSVTVNCVAVSAVSGDPSYFMDFVSADYQYTLAITPQAQITEEGYRPQFVHITDDNNEERITLATDTAFYASWAWQQLSEVDSGTILDIYHDYVKSNGIGTSFIWQGYTVRWDTQFGRTGNASSRWGTLPIRLRLLGKSPYHLTVPPVPTITMSTSTITESPVAAGTISISVPSVPTVSVTTAVA
jgi:hypothetical protein